MLYLNSEELLKLKISWYRIIEIINQAVELMEANDFSQPIKPYLRFKDLTNRIIAMPAYLGGSISSAGIKWISSFPKNVEKGLLRAHSVTILNEVDTGMPKCIFNTALISSIRTAGVSGLLINEYLKWKKEKAFNIGIIGFGPIGKIHFQMLSTILNNKIDRIYLYDLKGISLSEIPPDFSKKVVLCNSWEEAYCSADIFVTCTVSGKRYIDQKPKPGSLLLNISLRDFKEIIYDHVDYMIVDDWQEVCRENTDIELMHNKKKLQKQDTFSIVDVSNKNILKNIKDDDVIMFNPMGMAVFDIAVAQHFYQIALEKNVGTVLAN